MAVKWLTNLKQEIATALKSYPAQGLAPYPVNPMSYNRQDNQLMWFFGADGHDHAFDYSGVQSSLTAYFKCPPIAAITNKKALAYLTGKDWILNINGKGKEKVSEKPQAKFIRELFARPNPIQSRSAFESQQYVYTQVFGYCPVLRIAPVGMESDVYETAAMWNLPPFLIDWEYTNKIFNQTSIEGMVKNVYLRWDNQRIPIPLSCLTIIRDNVPSFSNYILPDSRLCSLTQPINNIIGAYESRGELINYRGARGLFSQDVDPNGTIPIDGTEKEQIHSDFRRYGLLKGQAQFVITSASLTYQSIGQPTAELMLFEEVEGSTETICQAFGYPNRLFQDSKSNSLGGSDVNEFKKQLYQDTIIPEAKNITDQWNEVFHCKEYGINIEKDFSEVPVLQEDAEKNAKTRLTQNQALEKEFYNGMLTLNEWRVKNGEDPLINEDGRGDLLFPEYCELYGDPRVIIKTTDNGEQKSTEA